MLEHGSSGSIEALSRAPFHGASRRDGMSRFVCGSSPDSEKDRERPFTLSFGPYWTPAVNDGPNTACGGARAVNGPKSLGARKLLQMSQVLCACLYSAVACDSWSEAKPR